MANRVFLGGTAILPDRLVERAAVVVSSGRIEMIVSSDCLPDACRSGYEIVDCAGQFIAPGFVDIHVHGGDGADFMDGTVDAVAAVCNAHARHGTTTLFATTTTGSQQEILQTIDSVRKYQEAPTSLDIAGVHLYGPYFAEDKVGCHIKSGRRSPLAAEFKTYFDSGLVRIATCAAELPGAADFYAAAMEAGCLLTCGHSNASWPEMEAAFDRGVRHVDHFWCAMSSVPSLRARFGTPMQASMAEYVLMNKEMSTEVIADGHHLSPELMEFAYQMLGPDRLCLVTDCNRALDMPPGDYRFGNLETGSMFESDGQVGWAPGKTSLASSIVGMDHMVRTMFQQTTATLPEVVRMASLTPARRTGIDGRVGSLQPGKQADLLVLSQDLQVQSVVYSQDEQRS